MKKLLFTFAALFMMTVSASAMSYEQARQQALFLTDKMAYELNLTEEQYEAAYEINLDYLMSVNHYDDLYGTYWEHRNLDLSYILLDWQYRAFLNASYFYRPLYWRDGFWHFGIYARYPYRDYFYFGMPRFYAVYRGGHSWHMNGGRSWYHGRDWHRPHHGGAPHSGMRDGFNRGDYGQGNRGMNPPRHGNNDGRNQHFGDNRRSENLNNGHANNGHIGSSSQPHQPMTGTRSGSSANGSSNRQTGGGNFGGVRNSTEMRSNAATNSTRFGRESSTRTTVNNPPSVRTTTTRQNDAATRQAPVSRSDSYRSSGSSSSRSSSSFGGSASRSSSSASRSSSFGGSSSRSSSSASRSSSFGRSSSRSSSSHSSAGASTRSSGGSHSSGGHSGGSRGGNFGGRR